MADSVYKQADWLSTTNIYEVNIRQYTARGSFEAFAAELPRLKDMGVEVLWFMPIHPIGEKNRKGTMGSYYSVKDFKAVNPEFGTAAEFKKLVNYAHQLEMKVILDWVANHAAWDNVWTIDHPGYFERETNGNFKTPYNWTDVIQIDHSNAAEQEAMIDAMKYWVTDFDIDGFRADLAHLTPLSFWKKARTSIEPLKENLFWLAETEEINYHEVFDASFTWEWMHKTEDYCKGNANLNSLKDLLHKYDAAFPANAYRMYFTSNHDENSWNGTEYEKYGEAAPALAVFNATWNGIPLIYSGQEQPNRKRLKFFDKDVIAWAAECELHSFYKKLLLLKKQNAALFTGKPGRVTYLINIEGNNDVLAYLQSNAHSAVLVLLNMGKNKIRFQVKDTKIYGHYRNVFNEEITDIYAGKEFEMEPGGYLVYEAK